MARLEGAIRFRTSEFDLRLPRIETILESNPVGLEAAARVDGVSVDEALTSGYRSLALDERTPPPRRRITSRWSLASKAIGRTAGGFAATWGSTNQTSFAFGELPTWMMSVNWAGQSTHHRHPWVSIGLKITAPLPNLLDLAEEIRSDVIELFVDLLEVPDGLFGYVSVTNEETNRMSINGFTFDDAIDGVFSYDWFTWVPSHLAERLVPADLAAASVSASEIAGASGGQLIVTSQPPIALPTDELRSVRRALEPVLLPTRPESPMRAFLREHDPSRARPPGLLAEDWL